MKQNFRGSNIHDTHEQNKQNYRGSIHHDGTNQKKQTCNTKYIKQY
jgi:hypothetical protein